MLRQKESPMTTTVTVKARAHGAVVETNGETTNIGPNREQTFHIAEGSQSFNVTQPAEAPQSEGFVDEATGTDSAEVAGRDQNDELLGRGGRRAKPPTGNETGADETAQTNA
jgi:hypothetical protein